MARNLWNALRTKSDAFRHEYRAVFLWIEYEFIIWIYSSYAIYMDGITDSMIDVSLSELWKMVMDRETWRAAIHGVAKSRTWLSDWTELCYLHKEQCRECICIKIFSHSSEDFLRTNSQEGFGVWVDLVYTQRFKLLGSLQFTWGFPSGTRGKEPAC